MCCTVLEIPCSRAGLEGPCPACGATIIAPSVVSVQPPQMVEVSPASQPNMESMGNEVDEAHAGSPTTRLCDRPSRPVFAAREAGNLPEPHPPKSERKRRKRSVVSKRSVVNMGEPTLERTIKREFWLILLGLVVLAVGAALAIYGDEIFRGIEAAPTMQR
ncbi:MAG: hypothetical protein L7V86_21420 [Verrucomicrobiales bacterium]|nr:hypothetical protein [Verrucomicrobiales bacterium]